MNNLVKFFLKRIAAMIVILLVLTAIIFALQRISHTNPVHAYLGANASRAAIAKESAILGYNKPVIDQYFHYVAGLLHGNLGRSLRTRRRRPATARFRRGARPPRSSRALRPRRRRRS